jgi:hypothetical protein
MFARHAVEPDAPARQQFRDVKRTLGALATRHQFAAKGDAHARPRPAVEATPALLTFRFPPRTLAPPQQRHRARSADCQRQAA